MAWFAGDIKDGVVLVKKDFWENFLLDLTFREDECVWKHREELERYFLTVGAIFCWTVIVPVIKLKLYFESRKKTDHRKA